MSLIFRNDARSIARRVILRLCHVALIQEFVDTPVNGRLSLFRIDSVYQMETSLFHALLVY
jgi:hypothetical protein